jgi:hypothetical protein
VREQLERAAAGEAIVEEDDGGEIPWPASLAGAAGRLLVQEGRGNEALLLAWLDSSGWLLGDWQRWAKQRPAWSRAARSAAEWGRGKSGLGDGFLGDVQSSGKEGPTHIGGDDRRPPAPSALHAVNAAMVKRDGARDRVTISGDQMGRGR